ncbi:MAG: FG-GAP-like repeat-containing protein [Actinomycetota bacterium]|nr:FG-GAP-like repeat-containing protein [Actinomycetota bacterium]
MRATRTLLAVTAATFASLTFGVSSGMAASSFTDYSTNFTRVESLDSQATGRWSERLATVPDLNGDGKNELLMADLSEDFGGFTNAGRVYMQDGATRNFMYFIDAPQIQALAQFGFFISVIGDVNGDGKADFAAGTDAQDTLADGTPCIAPASPAPLGTCNQDQGKAWVFSGTNGQVLYALNNPHPQGFARFGSRIGRAGDANNDGVPDVIVGASNNDVTTGGQPEGTPGGCGNDPTTGRPLLTPAPLPAGCHANEGEAFIFSGKASDHAAGASGYIRTLNIPASDQTPAPCGEPAQPGSPPPAPALAPCGNLGLAVQGFGDVTGDGVVDDLVDASVFNFDTATNGPCANPAAATCNKGQGAEYLFNGATGALIRRADDPVPQAGATWGFQDAEPLAPGDLNGDGKAEYWAHGFAQNGPNGEQTGGRSWVFNGATGAVLFEVKDPTPVAGGEFGWSLAKTDYNKDGTPDLYVGQAPHGVLVDQSGGTYVFNGKDGSLLKSLELPASDAQIGANNNVGSALGWTVAAPGDLNGDGEPDYVAGSPFTDAGPSAFNCQAPTAGCVQDVGREYFFYSSVPVTPPGGGGGGTGTGTGSTSNGTGMTSTGNTSGSDTTAPGVSSYGLSNNPFVVSGSSTPTFGSAAAKRKHKKGTTFRYTLSEAATVKIVISQRRSGRRKAKRCVAPTFKLRNAKKCTRVSGKGTLTRISKQGVNSVAFTGRIATKALSPGNYQATLSATDAANNSSKGRTIFFTIVNR